MRRYLSRLCIPALLAIAACAVSSATAATIQFQHGVSPDASYEYDHAVLRTDDSDTPAGDINMLVGTTDSGHYLRSLIEFDLSSQAAALSSADISEVSLQLHYFRVDGTPKVDIYTYDSPVSRLTSRWDDPDGDGNPATGDMTPGGTLGTYIGTLGELATTANHSPGTPIVLGSSPALIAAVESALASDNLLRFILVEDNPDPATRDIAFFRSQTGSVVGTHPMLSVTTVPEPQSIAMVSLLATGAFLGLHRQRKLCRLRR